MESCRDNRVICKFALYFNIWSSTTENILWTFLHHSHLKNFLFKTYVSMAIYHIYASCRTTLDACCNAVPRYKRYDHVNGLVQGCSISIANALEMLQSCTEPSIYSREYSSFRIGGLSSWGMRAIIIRYAPNKRETRVVEQQGHVLRPSPRDVCIYC